MLIVQKFGGTSVGSIERLRAVADRVQAAKKLQADIVVVLSARSGETDQLLKEASQLSENPDPRECDMLLSTGEQKSVALLALCLIDRGIPAISLAAHQVPIYTDDQHQKARIQAIDTQRIQRELKTGKVVVVTGFQGITKKGEITTLGRGGSDTSAVALAAALKADHCEIYTDVDGVYTADPKHVPEARLLKKISYEEMLELADTGAKVLQTRSVELAALHSVPLKVKSSFTQEEGTSIVSEEESLEKLLVSGISLNTNEAKIAIRKIPPQKGVLTAIFSPIAKAAINVDMIVENLGADGTVDIGFTVAKEELKKTMRLTDVVARQLKAGHVETAADIAKISIVGLGMRTHAGVADTLFQILNRLDIEVQMVTTSEIKVSFVVAQEQAKRAMIELHKAFGLSDEN